MLMMMMIVMFMVMVMVVILVMLKKTDFFSPTTFTYFTSEYTYSNTRELRF
jgi:hypothetical protein